jgi:hypothetical protein
MLIHEIIQSDFLVIEKHVINGQIFQVFEDMQILLLMLIIVEIIMIYQIEIIQIGDLILL